jgi:hypothetical protein
VVVDPVEDAALDLAEVDVVDRGHGGEPLPRRSGQGLEMQPVALVAGVGLEPGVLSDLDAVVEDGLVVGNGRHVHVGCSRRRGRVRP